MRLHKTRLTLNPFRLTGFYGALCFAAAAFMLLGATHAAAHDHDHEHEAPDIDGGECIVCVAAAFSAAKMSPDVPSAVEPEAAFAGRSSGREAIAPDRFDFRPNPARGPPPFISSP